MQSPGAWNVADLGKMMNKDPLDAAFDLIIQSHDNTGAVYFSMNEQDVKLAMRQPWVSVDNDASGVSPDGILGESKTHPRAYGTFPRILGKYVRDEKNLTLAETESLLAKNNPFATLKPFAVVMAGPNEFDPYKD